MSLRARLNLALRLLTPKGPSGEAGADEVGEDVVGEEVPFCVTGSEGVEVVVADVGAGVGIVVGVGELLGGVVGRASLDVVREDVGVGLAVGVGSGVGTRAGARAVVRADVGVGVVVEGAGVLLGVVAVVEIPSLDEVVEGVGVDVGVGLAVGVGSGVGRRAGTGSGVSVTGVASGTASVVAEGAGVLLGAVVVGSEVVVVAVKGRVLLLVAPKMAMVLGEEGMEGVREVVVFIVSAQGELAGIAHGELFEVLSVGSGVTTGMAIGGVGVGVGGVVVGLGVGVSLRGITVMGGEEMDSSLMGRVVCPLSSVSWMVTLVEEECRLDLVSDR